MWAGVFNACGKRVLFQQRGLWESWIPIKQLGCELHCQEGMAFSWAHLDATHSKNKKKNNLSSGVALVNNIFP